MSDFPREETEGKIGGPGHPFDIILAMVKNGQSRSLVNTYAEYQLVLRNTSISAWVPAPSLEGIFIFSYRDAPPSRVLSIQNIKASGEGCKAAAMVYHLDSIRKIA